MNYSDKAQPTTWRTHHTHNVNTKVNFVFEHNISSTSKTHSGASWTPVCWVMLTSCRLSHMTLAFHQVTLLELMCLNLWKCSPKRLFTINSCVWNMYNTLSCPRLTPDGLWCFNSSPPSAIYMRRWTGSTLVQIMACRLVGAEPLSEPMLEYCYWTLRNNLQENCSRNSYIFIQENAFENVVCKMADILSMER